MENDLITQSQMLGYIGIDYRYLPNHVKNGLVIVLCIFERTILDYLVSHQQDANELCY